jgi:hypothetical protein
VATGREDAVASVYARRARHRAKSLPVRVVWAATGLVVFVASIPLIVVAPELGLPLVLVALRMLALEFDWAAKAYARIEWRWRRFRTWWRGRSRALRAAVILGAIAVVIAIVSVLVS